MPTVPPRSIVEEIEQTKPFKTKRQEALVAILRTADMVKRFLASGLREHDITGQQFNVLRILRGAGPGGIPTLSIPDRMIEQTPGITRLLDRLEERGLAERRRCTEDRRRVYCVITENGKRLLDELDPVTAHADETAMSGIADEQLDQFLVTLSRVRAGVLGGWE